jgi:hypothetical protein
VRIGEVIVIKLAESRCIACKRCLLPGFDRSQNIFLGTAGADSGMGQNKQKCDQ